MRTSQSGFTLIEMSVVLVIIGLLVAGVLSGRSIIQSSETRAVMSEVRRHMQSFDQFVDKYHNYPGDMRNADIVFKTAIDAAVAAYNSSHADQITAAHYDGNGDNQIVWADEEGSKAWFHMQLAGLTDGTFTGSGINAVLNSNVPASTIGGGGNGYFINYNNIMQNYLGLGSMLSGGGINSGSGVSPQRAEAIDKKLDDGKPTTGFVQSVNGADTPPTDCQNNIGGYNIGDPTYADARSCLLQVRLDN